jgi:hypothetical protein
VAGIEWVEPTVVLASPGLGCSSVVECLLAWCTCGPEAKEPGAEDFWSVGLALVRGVECLEMCRCRLSSPVCLP